MFKYIKPVAICSALLVMMFASCKNDDYYQDGGKAEPKFNGNIMQYLESNPAKFDTIVQIIKLADLEGVLSNEEVTFFCPTDEVIRRTIGTVNRVLDDPYKGQLNQYLFDLGKDTIANFSDVPSNIWRKYLMRYIFKGKNVLKDYPQLDFGLTQLYPGGFYRGYNDDLSNIGVVYNSTNGVAYTGYRQLSISFIRDSSTPELSISAAVATSDVQPSNGVVHVLAVTTGQFIGETYTDPGGSMFGFGDDFWVDVIFNR
ncbi:MAG TPA: hypothetical protein VKB19_00935 [Pedobacter sp.]|nr:hypothetical protein [Pedobacter sp.]